MAKKPQSLDGLTKGVKQSLQRAHCSFSGKEKALLKPSRQRQQESQAGKQRSANFSLDSLLKAVQLLVQLLSLAELLKSVF